MQDPLAVRVHSYGQGGLELVRWCAALQDSGSGGGGWQGGGSSQGLRVVALVLYFLIVNCCFVSFFLVSLCGFFSLSFIMYRLGAFKYQSLLALRWWALACCCVLCNNDCADVF